MREQAQEIEAQRWDPEKTQIATGNDGVISATGSPIAVQAGLQALKQGGNAADAAATVALTQIIRHLGALVSYSGIMTLLYYDAKTAKVYSLDAGYNSYQNETDPRTIPVNDLGPLNFGRKPTVGGARGRETLVPGFMAGIQAMHDRFGKLPFSVLFEPAIWYAKNGVTISSIMAGMFRLRERSLSKSIEGRHFLHQAGDALPKPGDRFVQPELARTLSAVAANGAGYMYTGEWGKAFVAAVQNAGGKVTIDDLRDYRATWTEPYEDDVFSHTVYVNGPPNNTVYQVLTGLNLAAALKLNQRAPYWSDSVTFRDLTRICAFVSDAPQFAPVTAFFLRSKGIDVSSQAQRTKAFAASVAPLLNQLFAHTPGTGPHHSDSLVVVDKDGDVAAITHTSNAVFWGDTGIVVGGIPLPDAAGFQQERLAQLRPGDRLPNEIACTLTFEGSKPVLATAPIGSALVPETIKTIFGVIGQNQALTNLIAQPPLLTNFRVSSAPLSERPVAIPADVYDPRFLTELKALGVTLTQVPAGTALALRGVLSIVSIDPATGQAFSPEVPGIPVFSGMN